MCFIRVERSLKSYGNLSIFMRGCHHGICCLKDIFVKLHVKEATKFQPEKHKVVLLPTHRSCQSTEAQKGTVLFTDPRNTYQNSS